MVKKIFAVLLSAVLIACMFTGCSGGAKMTEENVTKTVEKAEAALKDFDIDALKKYVDSPTLSMIYSYAEKHEQLRNIGKVLFENLELEIVNIDLENSQVTLKVTNKDMADIAKEFATQLKSDNTTVQLLAKLNNEVFLDASYYSLRDKVKASDKMQEETEVTLTILQGKKNLALSFDNESEDIVSGGALSAIKKIFN